MFAYWFVHGSIDWLWEFAGLGGPALAGLGLAAALGARTVRPGAAPVLAGRRRPVAAAAVGLLALIALVPAWLSERDLRGARAEAGTNPAGALGRLDRAASLNPLSPLPDSTAGTIRVGAGDLLGARRDYRHALERYPYDPFATVMLAGIASSQGLDAEALRLASRAHELAPKDAVIGSQLRRLRARRQIDPLRIQAAFRKDIQIRIGND
jgi:tetratricopeptide (TPR) repeat protein